MGGFSSRPNSLHYDQNFRRDVHVTHLALACNLALYSVPKFRSLTELFRRNSVFSSFRENNPESEEFRKIFTIPRTQKNIDHTGLQGLFPVIISTIVRAFKNTAKDPRKHRVRPAQDPRKTRVRPAYSAEFFRKKIIPSVASPGNGKPFIFPKNSRKEPENNATFLDTLRCPL